MRESKSQEVNTTEDTNYSSDRNTRSVEPKTSYQSHIKPIDTLAGPRQPKLLKFPVGDPKSRKTKSFNVSWYQQSPWLEYDIENDAAFCYCYSKFSSNTSTSSAALTFTQTGYSNWANALDSSKGFHRHERSELHRNSFPRWMELRKIQEGKEKNIIERMCPEREEVARENREYLRCLFKNILWFATNEVPMRANDKTDESQNAGKWVSFIRLQLETNSSFRQLHEKFIRTRSIDYTSRTSVNDIIEVIAQNTRRIIYSQIKDAGIFSALIDENKDAAKREELALAVRYSAGTQQKITFLF